MKYYYGARTLDSNETATYEYPLIDLKQSSYRKTWSAAADYSIGSREAWGVNGTTIAGHSSFTPIAPLRRDDADVAILFLSANDIGYFAPVDDPWYGAHRVAGHFFVPSAGADSLGLAGQTQPYYRRDEPAAALACVTQAQFCNPRLPEAVRCTTPGGYLDLNARVAAIVRNDEERNLLNWYRWASLLDAESLASVPSALGVASLVSSGSAMWRAGMR
ncbi:cytochrome p450 protein [Neofusicoccum parvum]|uniref:Cytochrome p450 protein n=1 Tax=Neofusicoccum parvum TaxID=310453 RepID=A0ACB5SPT3_9PEZI|nr:cytochrome p450 protein [Neofusicoccum parvum]